MAMRRNPVGPSKAAIAMEMLFQKSLVDLVKGLRGQVGNETKYLAQALADVRKEMKSMDPHCKALALQKLTYLHMLQGTDMTWASFPIVEVMSSPGFTHKQIGYLGACQCFNDETEVALLLPNLLRKDLGSPGIYEAGLALNCLASVATPDLARDLMPDVFTMLNSSRPYVRKKAIIALLKMLRQYPEGLKTVFRRLTERLNDEEESVVRTTVTVLCELVMEDPKSYLSLAPDFYRLLTTSTNNWVLIKLVKIFRALAPLEPRLAQKLGQPLCDIMRNTPAKSLLFECVSCVTETMSQHQTAMAYSLLRLRELVDESDPNLRYLGLRTMVSLIDSYPNAISEHKSSIVACLDDVDPGVQNFALRLVSAMVTRENLIPTVNVLQQHMSPGNHITNNNTANNNSTTNNTRFTDELVGAVLKMCSHECYQRVVDFEWYLDVLVHLSCVEGSSHGKEVARQIIDIPVRVKAVRGEAVKKVRRLLLDATAFIGGERYFSLDLPLAAAAWVTGEYSQYIEDFTEALESLLQPKVRLLGPSVQAMFIQAVLKVFLEAMDSEGRRRRRGREKKAEEIYKGKEKEKFSYDSVFSVVTGDLSSTESVRKGDQRGDIVEGVLEEKNTLLEPSLSSFPSSSPSPSPSRGSFEALIDLVSVHIREFEASRHMEVQERVSNVLVVIEIFREEGDKDKDNEKEEFSFISSSLKSLFVEELRPVAIRALERVVVPEGLELENSVDLLKKLGRENMGGSWEGSSGFRLSQSRGNRDKERETKGGEGEGEEEEESSRASEIRSGRSLLKEHRERHDPFYLPVTLKETKEENLNGSSSEYSSTKGERKWREREREEGGSEERKKESSLSRRLMEETSRSSSIRNKERPLVQLEEDDLPPLTRPEREEGEGEEGEGEKGEGEEGEGEGGRGETRFVTETEGFSSGLKKKHRVRESSSRRGERERRERINKKESEEREHNNQNNEQHHRRHRKERERRSGERSNRGERRERVGGVDTEVGLDAIV